MAVSLEKGRKNIETERDILTKLERYEIGITTLDIYEKDQTVDWNVEHVERGSKAKKFMDNIIEMEIYVKDMVSSVYGESLVCELEFHGKGKKSDEITLSSIICKMDGEVVISRGN